MKLKKVLETWQRPEDLIDLSKTRVLDTDQCLMLESSSFYLPIQACSVLRGPNEADKTPPIRVLYNLLRGQDNGGEDSDLSDEERLWVLRDYPYFLSLIERIGDENGDKLEKLLSGDELKNITSKMVEGARTDSEKVFAEQLGKGEIYREFHSLKRPLQKEIHTCIAKMADGMSHFVERGAIQTVDVLKDYCEDVAGSIGRSLNRFVRVEDGTNLDDDLAVKCGEYLQLINITKGLRKDSEEERVFLPAELHQGMAHSHVMNGIDPSAVEARRNCLQSLIDTTERNFASTVDYLISIPPTLPGYKSFAIMPFLIGRETLELMKNSGSERVFRGDPSAIKIPYGLETIPYFVESLVTKDQGKHTNDWLEAYKSSPNNFPFDPERFGQWAPKFFRKGNPIGTYTNQQLRLTNENSEAV